MTTYGIKSLIYKLKFQTRLIQNLTQINQNHSHYEFDMWELRYRIEKMIKKL
jgi:hypothetical protein